MSQPLHISRARLRASRGEALSAIAKLLIPDDPSKQAGHAHRVLWLLFQDIPDAARDFLWRDEGNGKYMLLSARPPVDPLGLFDLDTKEFEPSLKAGDRLSFSLRANPVVASKVALKPEQRAARARGKKIDVVMKALHDVPKTNWDQKTGRAFERDRIAADAGAKWLAEQGTKSGFKLARTPLVDGYTQVQVERNVVRGSKKRPAGFSVLNLSGELEVTDPAAFLSRLPEGFGSAKAFGNGLMLIRRA